MGRDVFLFAGGVVLTALAVQHANMSALWDWVLLGGIALMVSSAVHGLATAHYRRGGSGLPPILILAGADVLIFALITSTFWAQTEPPRPSTPPPALPAQQPPPAPRVPPKPWVTDEEIAHEKLFGRTLLVYSPEELLHLWEEGQDLKIFIDKWIKVDGPSVGPPMSEPVEKKEYYLVQTNIKSERFMTVGLVALFFDPKKYADRLLMVRKGDRVQTYCQFEGVQHKDAAVGQPFAFNNVIGYNCDLL
jgi:hypothetical protein